MSLDIHPIRCLACGAVLGNKYDTFHALQQRLLDALMSECRVSMSHRQKVVRLEGTATAKALAVLGIRRECCRSQLMTSVSKAQLMFGAPPISAITRNTIHYAADESKVVEIQLPRETMICIGKKTYKRRETFKVRMVDKPPDINVRPT